MIYNLTEIELAYYRKALRITSAEFDDEINILANEAIADLMSSGGYFDFIGSGDKSLFDDPYLVSIVLLYIKSSFGLENPDQAWYTEQYSKKKAEMLNKSAYTAEDSDV